MEVIDSELIVTYTNGVIVNLGKITADGVVAPEKKHTVTFQNPDGSEIQSANYAYGDVVTAPAAPEKAADAQYTYEFAGWDVEVVDVVTGAATYTAVYTPTVRSYTVKFVDYNGDELKSETLAYGSEVTPPADPTRAADAQFTYTFNGWDAEIVAVEGDATYTATYSTTTNKYNVTWIVEGVETTVQVEYGTTPVFEGTTDKAGNAQFSYTFAGWTPEVVAVTGDATYTATYSTTTNKYTITWSVNGATTTEEYEYGATPAFTGSTDKAADAQFTYTFNGWDAEIVAVEGDATYTATYSTTTNKYNVTWIVEGVETTVQVEYGTTPVFEGTTDKAGNAQFSYTFAGWTPEVVAVTGDATYTATYSTTTNKYTITWSVNGATTTEEYEYGATPAFTGSTDKAADAQFTYTFTGWNPTVANVTGNATYTAQYSTTLNEYTVTYVYYKNNGATYEAAATVEDRSTTRTVKYGENAPAYEPPVGRTGMTYVGYGDQLNNITGDKTVYAQYTVNAVSNLTVVRNFRFKASFDYIKMGANAGAETITGAESSYSGSSSTRKVASYANKSTDASSKIVLKGWMGFTVGQEELVWTIGTQTSTNSSVVAGPWYSCVNGNYHAAEDAVINGIKGVMKDGVYNHVNDKNRFANVEIDLSAYKDKTINIIVAIRAADGNATVCLEFTNLKVN